MDSQQNIISELLKQNAELCNQNAELRNENAELQKMFMAQKEVIAHLQRMLFGKKSEKVVYDPSTLLPGLEDFFNQKPAPEKEEEKTVVDEHTRSKGQPLAGWNGFPEELEREEKIIDLPEEEKDGLTLIGYDVSERLVHRNAYIVQVIKRAKYTEQRENGSTVITAPAPAVPSCLALDSNRCHYDPSVIIHVIAEKLIDHIPFYRQSQMFGRYGIEFGRSAMCSYFSKVSDALTPLYQAMAKEVMDCEILHADETRVPMLDPKNGKTKLCWIWVRKTGLGPPLTVFHFSLDRSSKTARELLGDYLGTIIRDGYAAYGCLSAEAAGCWAHCRRKFFEAKENASEYACQALALVNLLYQNERYAKESAMEKTSETALFKQRRLYRKKSEPIVRQYFALCREIQEKEPPSSAIAKAAAYSLNQEGPLKKFLENPKLNIDNNPCENVIRPFCIGRKNWLFVGNEDGGTSMAALASFAATCKDNGVDFEAWLNDVLFKLDTCPSSEIRTLLPHIWKTIQ